MQFFMCLTVLCACLSGIFSALGNNNSGGVCVHEYRVWPFKDAEIEEM